MKHIIKYTPEMLAKLNNGEYVELIPPAGEGKFTVIDAVVTINDIPVEITYHTEYVQ